jgi:hypothetical protein
MTGQEWLTCADPQKMLQFLLGKVSGRKLRLFAVACCRRIWPLLTDERSRQAVETAERYADDVATKEELAAAGQSAWAAKDAAKEADKDAARAAARATEFVSYQVGWDAAWDAAWDTAREAARAAREAANQSHAALLRDISGNLSGAAFVDASWLSWNDGTVRRIAQGIYEERRMPEGTLDNARLAILADALEESGCTDPDILAHCRQPGLHVRGCWVVDLLLGKE